ncbi:hypothetical protein J4444_03710, partial [Candidatus Woesearchaeota archaeon]|nr:hypothetical protein [Candidatus Woesearchaeota archaeon]
AAKGLDESTLRLWYYNETSASWMKYDTPDGGVDTTNNYVWASTTHFSTWGVFGTAPSSGGSSGGSGGGGGSSRSTVKTPITPINPAALIPQIFRTVVPTVTETTTAETLQTSTTESTNPTTAQNADANQGNLLTGAAVSDAGAGVFSSGSWPIYAIGLTVLVLGGSGVYFARRRKVA